MYLRGLGIGIVVTALLMGFTAGKKQTMTDEEIKAKAVSLGMVEQESVLKPVVSQDQADPVQEPAAEPTQVPETKPTKAPTQEPTPEPTPAPEEKQEDADAKAEDVAEEAAAEPAAEQVQADDAKEEAKPAETVKQEETKEQSAGNVRTEGTFTLQIAGGYGSEKVCALLEKGGLISSAADFDKYLCDHGYDHKIRAGTYTIAAGSDYETIAKIITGRQ